MDDRETNEPGSRQFADGPASEDRAIEGGADVVVVGGGLAGLAATLALSERGLRVRLLESRHRLGGRASSYADPESGELVDFCQHVSMGCCREFADFCRRLGIADRFTPIHRLEFVGPNGKRYRLGASPLLPAPLHLAPAFLRLGYLTWRDRIAIARALERLRRADWAPSSETQPFSQWLAAQGQTPAAIEGFWQTVLISALAEKVDRISLAAARQVFVDGFLTDRRGYEVFVPDAPLAELFGACAVEKLASLGASIRPGATVRQIRSPACVELADGQVLTAKYVVLAAAWRQAASLVAPELHSLLPQLDAASRLEGSPITGIHLWFDRPITTSSHLILVGRQSHWLFSRGTTRPLSTDGPAEAYYYQVVISASRDFVGADRERILGHVLDDLAFACPAAREARLLGSRIVTQREAVFSPLPGSDRLRPEQRTSLPWLYLAGDWTRTGWPSTMEGAVRSGFLAADAILKAAGIC